jgi:DNA-binding CsgD family transcriptional regulator
VFNRSRRGFAPGDRAVVEVLLPHLRQAVGHRRRVARLRRTLAARQATTPVPAVRTLVGLTAREREVVACLASGATDHQIGRRLGISGRTVGKHLENVYRKLDLPGRAVLVAALAGPVAA